MWARLPGWKTTPRIRPTRLTMEDALKKGEVSVLDYDSMNVRDLPERMFTREYLRKLE